MRQILEQGHTWCSFYALDPWAENMPLVAAGIVGRTIGAARRAVEALKDGVSVLELEAGSSDLNDLNLEAGDLVKLQIANSLTLEIPTESGEVSTRRYLLSYERTIARFSIGVEIGVVMRDATMMAGYGHIGYLLTSPEEPEDQRLARFFHLWGRTTGLPAKPEWAGRLWSVGLKLGLIQALETYGVTGWRVDPRRSRPDDKPGWDHVLKLLVGLS